MISLLLFRIPAVLLFSLAFLSCTVFRPVGNAISDGYQNTVAYFNSYYNAKALFDEAESEVLAAQADARAREGFSETLPAPSRNVVAKFSTVIDKCSNILSFQAESALVDDALFLIGRSYFYQAEYVKAERKFVELRALYESGPLKLEGSYWYAKTLVALKNDDEAEQVLISFEEQALAEGEEALAGRADLLLGIVRSRGQIPKEALSEFEDALERADDPITRAEARYRMGLLLLDQGEYRRAAEVFLRVSDETDELGMQFSAAQKAIHALREDRAYDDALAVTKELNDDYKFLSFEKAIAFEEALTLRAQGRVVEATDRLVWIDTTSVRTELGSKAAFELARMYEASGDYERARNAFVRATNYPVPTIVQLARGRAAAYNRYTTLTSERTKRDSIITSTPDSLLSSTSRDSLNQLQAVNAYELGDVFYSDLEVPDSAVVWFHTALGSLNDSLRTPRILFILAELSREDPVPLYREIIERFPRSVYSVRAKLKLGLPEEPVTADPAALAYEKAEHEIDEGDDRSAIRELGAILREYPGSPYAPKSAYTIGWIYEHRLQLPDSALTQYRTLVEHFGSSQYAAAVRHRLGLQAAAPDSVVTPPSREGIRDRLEQDSPGKRKTDPKKVIE